MSEVPSPRRAFASVLVAALVAGGTAAVAHLLDAPSGLGVGIGLGIAVGYLVRGTTPLQAWR